MEGSQWSMDTLRVKVYLEDNNLERRWGSKYIQVSQDQEGHKLARRDL